MYGKQSAWELYQQILMQSVRQLDSREMEALLETMQAEVLIKGNSMLLDHCCQESERFCLSQRIRPIVYEPVSYTLFETDVKKPVMAVFDAWQLPLLLADYMENSCLPERAERLMPYFFGNFLPSSPDSRQLDAALQRIDTVTLTLRSQIYEDRCGEKKDVLTKTESPIAAEETSLLDAARVQADALLCQAKQEAADIRLQAHRAAEQERLRIYASEQEALEAQFASIREELFCANESFRKLEETVSEQATRKAYTQLLELYNLIADARDSAASAPEKNQEVENTIGNLEVFLEMITEYLENYGIRTIVSRSGDPFSPRYHAVRKDVQFDPHSAVIEKSMRSGFVWGEQVLQKERIEL